jgi:hypothetical protein
MNTQRPIESCLSAVRSAPRSPDPRSIGTAPKLRMSAPKGLKRKRLSRAMIVYGRSRIELPQTGAGLQHPGGVERAHRAGADVAVLARLDAPVAGGQVGDRPGTVAAAEQIDRPGAAQGNAYATAALKRLGV